jgi:hypothetical protein
MPTSLVGLLLFVVLLAPGMCFRWRRTARQPIQKLSELREIAGVVLVSVACHALVLAVFGVWRSLRPKWALNPGRLVRDGGLYVETAYVPVLLWAAGLLVLACIAALGLAQVADDANSVGSRTYRLRCWLRASRDDDVTIEPAWWSMFADRRDEYVYAGCALDDGTYISGSVLSFSAEADETADRELVLTEPRIRGPRGAMRSMESSAVVISARRLQYVTVTYIPVAADPAEGLANSGK